MDILPKDVRFLDEAIRTNAPEHEVLAWENWLRQVGPDDLVLGEGMPNDVRASAASALKAVTAELRATLEVDRLDEDERADALNDLGVFEAIGAALQPKRTLGMGM